MKTKKRIIVAIKAMRDSRDSPISPQEYKLYINGHINALKWVLGYKSNKYYCVDCKLAHVDFRCPKCGSPKQ